MTQIVASRGWAGLLLSLLLAGISCGGDFEDGSGDGDAEVDGDADADADADGDTDPECQPLAENADGYVPCPTEGCAPGYTCQTFSGHVATQNCVILCTEDCQCPEDGVCDELPDAAGSWFQCMYTPIN